MRALDQERVKVREAFSLLPPHYELPEEVGKVFSGQFGNIGLEAGQTMKGPTKLTDRYLTEDVPMGLVFYSSVAKVAGVATPIIDSVITLVSELLGVNMFRQGRTVEELGLAGLTANELVKLQG